MLALDANIWSADGSGGAAPTHDELTAQQVRQQSFMLVSELLRGNVVSTEQKMAYISVSARSLPALREKEDFKDMTAGVPAGGLTAKHRGSLARPADARRRLPRPSIIIPPSSSTGNNNSDDVAAVFALFVKKRGEPLSAFRYVDRTDTVVFHTPTFAKQLRFPIDDSQPLDLLISAYDVSGQPLIPSAHLPAQSNGGLEMKQRGPSGDSEMDRLNMRRMSRLHVPAERQLKESCRLGSLYVSFDTLIRMGGPSGNRIMFRLKNTQDPAINALLDAHQSTCLLHAQVQQVKRKVLNREALLQQRLGDILREGLLVWYYKHPEGVPESSLIYYRNSARDPVGALYLSPPPPHRRVCSELESVRLASVFEVAMGKTTETFQQGLALGATAGLCCSVISTYRTIDLEASSSAELDVLVSSVNYLMKRTQINFNTKKLPENVLPLTVGKGKKAARVEPVFDESTRRNSLTSIIGDGGDGGGGGPSFLTPRSQFQLDAHQQPLYLKAYASDTVIQRLLHKVVRRQRNSIIHEMNDLEARKRRDEERKKKQLEIKIKGLEQVLEISAHHLLDTENKSKCHTVIVLDPRTMKMSHVFWEKGRPVHDRAEFTVRYFKNTKQQLKVLVYDADTNDENKLPESARVGQATFSLEKLCTAAGTELRVALHDALDPDMDSKLRLANCHLMLRARPTVDLHAALDNTQAELIFNDMERQKQLLCRGITFTMYQYGLKTRQPVLVFYREDEASGMGRLHYCGENMPKDFSPFIELANITDLYEGKQSLAFTQECANSTDDFHCLSIVSDPPLSASGPQQRTLALEAKTSSDKDQFILALRRLLLENNVPSTFHRRVASNIRGRRRSSALERHRKKLGEEDADAEARRAAEEDLRGSGLSFGPSSLSSSRKHARDPSKKKTQTITDIFSLTGSGEDALAGYSTDGATTDEDEAAAVDPFELDGLREEDVNRRRMQYIRQGHVFVEYIESEVRRREVVMFVTRSANEQFFLCWADPSERNRASWTMVKHPLDALLSLTRGKDKGWFSRDSNAEHCLSLLIDTSSQQQQQQQQHRHIQGARTPVDSGLRVFSFTAKSARQRNAWCEGVSVLCKQLQLQRIEALYSAPVVDAAPLHASPFEFASTLSGAHAPGPYDATHVIPVSIKLSLSGYHQEQDTPFRVMVVAFEAFHLDVERMHQLACQAAVAGQSGVQWPHSYVAATEMKELAGSVDFSVTIPTTIQTSAGAGTSCFQQDLRFFVLLVGLDYVGPLFLAGEVLLSKNQLWACQRQPTGFILTHPVHRHRKVLRWYQTKLRVSVSSTGGLLRMGSDGSLVRGGASGSSGSEDERKMLVLGGLGADQPAAADAEDSDADEEEENEEKKDDVSAPKSGTTVTVKQALSMLQAGVSFVMSAKRLPQRGKRMRTVANGLDEEEERELNKMLLALELEDRKRRDGTEAVDVLAPPEGKQQVTIHYAPGSNGGHFYWYRTDVDVESSAYTLLVSDISAYRLGRLKSLTSKDEHSPHVLYELSRMISLCVDDEVIELVAEDVKARLALHTWLGHLASVVPAVFARLRCRDNEEEEDEAHQDGIASANEADPDAVGSARAEDGGDGGDAKHGLFDPDLLGVGVAGDQQHGDEAREELATGQVGLSSHEDVEVLEEGMDCVVSVLGAGLLGVSTAIFYRDLGPRESGGRLILSTRGHRDVKDLFVSVADVTDVIVGFQLPEAFAAGGFTNSSLTAKQRRELCLSLVLTGDGGVWDLQFVNANDRYVFVEALQALSAHVEVLKLQFHRLDSAAMMSVLGQVRKRTVLMGATARAGAAVSRSSEEAQHDEKGAGGVEEEEEKSAAESAGGKSPSRSPHSRRRRRRGQLGSPGSPSSGKLSRKRALRYVKTASRAQPVRMLLVGGGAGREPHRQDEKARDAGQGKEGSADKMIFWYQKSSSRGSGGSSSGAGLDLGDDTTMAAGALLWARPGRHHQRGDGVDLDRITTIHQGLSAPAASQACDLDPARCFSVVCGDDGTTLTVELATQQLRDTFLSALLYLLPLFSVYPTFHPSL